MADNRNVTIDHYKNTFLIKEQSCKRIFSDNTSINRFIVSEAILKLLQLIESCHGEDSVLFGYNTDGIFMQNPKMTFRNKKDVKFSTSGEDSVLFGYNTDGIFMQNPKMTFRNKKDVKFSTKKIGKAYVTDSKLTYFDKHYRENMDTSDYKVKSGKGCIFNGQAGSGKTTKLCELVRDATNPLVLSFTNKAIENVKSRLIQKGVDKDEANKICHTFDSYFVNGMVEIYIVS